MESKWFDVTCPDCGNIQEAEIEIDTHVCEECESVFVEESEKLRNETD